MANMAPWHDFGKFLAFFDVSARPAWERSLEGVLEETSSRQRAKKLAKVLKIIPRPSKTEPRSLQRKAGRKVRMPATPRSRKFSWKSVETNEANIIATVWTFLARSGGAGEVVENLSHTGPQRVGG